MIENSFVKNFLDRYPELQAVTKYGVQQALIRLMTTCSKPELEPLITELHRYMDFTADFCDKYPVLFAEEFSVVLEILHIASSRVETPCTVKILLEKIIPLYNLYGSSLRNILPLLHWSSVHDPLLEILLPCSKNTFEEMMRVDPSPLNEYLSVLNAIATDQVYTEVTSVILFSIRNLLNRFPEPSIPDDFRSVAQIAFKAWLYDEYGIEEPREFFKNYVENNLNINIKFESISDFYYVNLKEPLNRITITEVDSFFTIYPRFLSNENRKVADTLNNLAVLNRRWCRNHRQLLHDSRYQFGEKYLSKENRKADYFRLFRGLHYFFKEHPEILKEGRRHLLYAILDLLIQEGDRFCKSPASLFNDGIYPLYQFYGKNKRDILFLLEFIQDSAFRAGICSGSVIQRAVLPLAQHSYETCLHHNQNFLFDCRDAIIRSYGPTSTGSLFWGNCSKYNFEEILSILEPLDAENRIPFINIINTFARMRSNNAGTVELSNFFHEKTKTGDKKSTARCLWLQVHKIFG